MSGLVLVVCAALLGAESDVADRQQFDIRRAVSQLADENYNVRERAMKFLWHAGRAAEKALEAAARSADPEVARRARLVLERFRFGIYPDTPAETVRMISAYRRGDDKQKREALAELHARGEVRPLVALMRAEQNTELRDHIFREYFRDLSRLTPMLLATGGEAELEQLLEAAAFNSGRETSSRNYAAFLLLTGRMGERLPQLVARAGDNDWRLIALLRTFDGKLTEAREAAEKSDQFLLAGILYQQREFAGLLGPGMTPGDPGLERLGFTAAFARLSGDGVALDEAARELLSLAKSEPDSAMMAAECLLVNERWDDALSVYGERGRQSAFSILSVQGKHRAALERLGCQKDASTGRWRATTWLALGRDDQIKQFATAVDIAKTWHRLGERESASELLAALDVLAADQPKLLARLADLEHDLGLASLADRHALAAIAQAPDQTSVALAAVTSGADQAMWWDGLRQLYPGEPPAALLERLRRFQQHSAATPDADFERIVRRAATALGRLGADQQWNAFRALVDRCLAAKEFSLAAEFAETRALRDETGEFWLRAGDAHAGQKAWDKAAECYDRAADLKPERPLARWLEGHALIQAGQAEAGRTAQRLAHIGPLGNVEARGELAEGLAARGFAADARAERELILRMGPYGAWEGGQAWALKDAARQVATEVVADQPARAADLWERMHLGLIKTNSAYARVETYAVVAQMIHKARGRGLLAAGRPEAALAEFRLAQGALPCDVGLTIDAVLALEQAKQPTAANELLAATRARLNEALSEFPRSGGHHNDLAWLLAKLGRDLDVALTHARQAVELRPTDAASRDTLAEVHFRRGERELAIREAEACLRQDPGNQHYQRQLARFKGEGKPPEATPSGTGP